MSARRSNVTTVTESKRSFLRLQRQIETARTELTRLREEVASAERELGATKAVQLLQANEQLVISALRIRAEAEKAAETAAAALDEAARLAEHDALTGLPNRLLLLDRLAQAIAGAKRHGTRSAVLFVDLNNFKQINDILGHAMGDEVLKLTARRLASSIRAVDTVSRHGGDEFLVLLAEVSAVSDAVAIADKITEALGVPCPLGEHVIRLTASIGISLYPDDGEDAATLIHHADAAMYRAKRQGLRSVALQEDAEPKMPTATLRSLQQPLTNLQQSQAEHERRHALLRETNEKLVLAALAAQDLQAAAEQALARQLEMQAVVAHELRNPLGSLRTAAASLGRGLDEPLLQRVHGIIERQVAHMTRLVGDLNDVSRAQAHKLRLECQPLDLGDVVDEAVMACRPAMDARVQNLGVAVAAHSLSVIGDRDRLVQVLCNLLDNASKYTAMGGQIRLSVASTEDDAVIHVSDNGIGISPEALPRIFDPFVQDKQAVGFSGAGLGIGLTVVRELVQAHGGQVAASSAGPGFGSSFVVALPLARR